MPSRPLQLAGLSLEPVYQQGYLTASAAPEASDSPSGWEGCQQSHWKERQRKWEREKKKKQHYEIRRHHSSELGVTASLQSHHFGDKNKPNYPLKKGHSIASLMMFTVWPVALTGTSRKQPTGTTGRLALFAESLWLSTYYNQLSHILALSPVWNEFRWNLKIKNRWAAFGFETALAHYSDTTNAVVSTFCS